MVTLVDGDATTALDAMLFIITWEGNGLFH